MSRYLGHVRDMSEMWLRRLLNAVAVSTGAAGKLDWQPWRVRGPLHIGRATRARAGLPAAARRSHFPPRSPPCRRGLLLGLAGRVRRVLGLGHDHHRLRRPDWHRAHRFRRGPGGARARRQVFWPSPTAHHVTAPRADRRTGSEGGGGRRHSGGPPSRRNCDGRPRSSVFADLIFTPMYCAA